MQNTFDRIQHTSLLHSHTARTGKQLPDKLTACLSLHIISILDPLAHCPRSNARRRNATLHIPPPTYNPTPRQHPLPRHRIPATRLPRRNTAPPLPHQLRLPRSMGILRTQSRARQSSRTTMEARHYLGYICLKITRESIHTNSGRERFVKDVQDVEKEVHVLTPTRYEAPKVRNESAAQRNCQMSFGQGTRMVQMRERREAQEAQVRALRWFGMARLGGGDGAL